MPVGKSVPRVDGLDKVTGRAKYCIDLELPHMLYAKVKRSIYPHARILRIDASKAERLAGVRAIITADDFPVKRSGFVLQDEPVLAWKKVRYIGEPVVVLAAETREIAEEAIDLIEIEYEELPAVFDPEEAFSSNPPTIIHEELPQYTSGLAIPLPKLDVLNKPNVFCHFKIRHGDLEPGFKEADLVVENRFSTAMIHHCQLEPHNAMAKEEPDGSLTVWLPTQSIPATQQSLATILQLPPSQIRVIVPYLGGGFGGKLIIKEAAYCAFLAKKTHRPIKLIYSRDEVFVGTHARVPFVIYIKDGAKKDGRIIAREMQLLLNAGAYGSIAYIIVRNCAFGAVGTYKISNFKLDAYGVYTNQPVGGAFRGLGSPQTIWPIEVQLDIIAERLGLDPVEVRMKNAMEEGDINPTGERMHSIGAKECLNKAAEAIGWTKPIEKGRGVWRRGRGISLGNKYSMAPSASCAIVKIHDDETIEVRTSGIEMGQGTNTVLAQIAAEEFGMPLEKVKIIFGDTALTPYDIFTGSSRLTYHMGNAVRLACLDAKRQIFEKAAHKLDARPDDLVTKNGQIYDPKVPERTIRIKDIFTPAVLPGYFLDEGGDIIGKATFYQRADMLDPETGQIPKDGLVGRPVAFYIHAAQAVDLEVNIETGKVRILRFVSAMDMGKAINPLNCEGQIEGGAGSMGIGSTLFEEMVMDRGNVLNPTFMDYKIVNARDIPPIQPIIVEAPHRDGPYGAKGLGEGVIVASAPAIANAIYNAIGVRFKDIPITSEKIRKALKGASINL